MYLNVEEISIPNLGIGRYEPMINFIKEQTQKGEIISDEIFSWIINPPVIYASAMNDEMQEIMRKKATVQAEKKPLSIKMVKLIKKEFYEFICTENDYYKKQRKLIGGNANLLIAGLSSAIAIKFNSIEAGIITSLVVTFFIVLGKMGKKVTCEFFKPAG